MEYFTHVLVLLKILLQYIFEQLSHFHIPLQICKNETKYFFFIFTTNFELVTLNVIAVYKQHGNTASSVNARAWVAAPRTNRAPLAHTVTSLPKNGYFNKNNLQNLKFRTLNYSKHYPSYHKNFQTSIEHLSKKCQDYDVEISSVLQPHFFQSSVRLMFKFLQLGCTGILINKRISNCQNLNVELSCQKC